jgi:hypothetical protein
MLALGDVIERTAAIGLRDERPVDAGDQPCQPFPASGQRQLLADAEGHMASNAQNYSSGANALHASCTASVMCWSIGLPRRIEEMIGAAASSNRDHKSARNCHQLLYAYPPA